MKTFRSSLLAAFGQLSQQSLGACQSGMRLPTVLGALMAFVLLLGASVARADQFQITLVGDLLGTGSFTTDGTCSMCGVVPFGSGLLTLTISIGSFTGPSAFDIVDDDVFDFGGPQYNRSANSLFVPHWDNSEAAGQLDFDQLGTWDLGTLSGRFIGTYTIAPASERVPEPSTLALLLSAVALLVFGLRSPQVNRPNHAATCGEGGGPYVPGVNAAPRGPADAAR